MRKILALLGIMVTAYGTSMAQILPTAINADPAAGSVALVGGGSQINQTGQIDYTVTNEAAVPPATSGIIPIGSLEITISFPNEYGLQQGLLPTVSGWTVLAYTAGPGGLIVLTNNQTIDAGAESVARVTIVGFVQTASLQTTTLTVDRRVDPALTVANTNPGNDVSSASIAVSAPLPIKLVSFTAKQKNCGVVALDWETSKEQNVSHFEVQYSKNGSQFSTVKRVQAQNAAMGATYSATVEQSEKEGFYRLRTVDFDGANSFSHVAKVMLTCLANEISVSPNPANNAFNITGMQTSGELLVYNMIGQQVLQQQIEAGASKIDITNLPAGNYNLIIRDAYGSKTTFKLTKL